MTNRERKLLIRTAGIGVALTVLAASAERVGTLDALERWLYDRRSRDCQYFTKPPTDKLVHLDIGDAALESIKRWPWPRSYIAFVLDELGRAGAKSIALDIILSEKQDPEIKELPGPTYIRTDHDIVLGSSIRKHGNVLVPIAFEDSAEYSDKFKTARMLLFNNLEINPEPEDKGQPSQMDILMAREGYETDSDGLDRDVFIQARREAMYLRIDAALSENRDLSIADLRKILLPNLADNVNDDKVDLLHQQYDRAQSAHALRQLVRETPEKSPTGPKFVSITKSLPPVNAIASQTQTTGYVYYEPDPDGAVRSLPLWVDHNGYLYPQMGLALACDYLDVDLKDVRIEKNRVIVPTDDGDIVLPTWHRFYESRNEAFDMTFSLPWFGPTGKKWDKMYSHKGDRDNDQHVPITSVWKVKQTLDRIRINNEQADDAIKFAFAYFEPNRLEDYENNPRDLDSPLARQHLIRNLLAIQTDEEKKAGKPLDETGDFFTQTVIAYKDMQKNGEDIGDEGQRMIAAWDALKAIYELNPDLADQLHSARTFLKKRFDDKAVLIGWVATGAIADFVPTPLHSSCPGVIVHGVVFNSVLTGETLTMTGPNVTTAVTLLVGLLTVALLVGLSPERASVAAIALIIGYFFVNGIILFDYRNIVLNAAGPLTAAAAVWGGCTLFRFVVERAERARIQRRFQSYVDPALVNYVIEHPEHARLDGEMRDLTVVFTDLQGFTTLSEKLREKTVGILNEYMELMVPIIREHDGYVNKFLGDGMMFFYGAPQANSYHAREAVLTCLKMQEAMVPFNKTLSERGLPNVHKRIGIASGPMVVGDAGPASASDYTVLGDTVNLSARLESANKYTGTWIMINQGTADLIGDMFLLRPVGRLQVVGKSEGIMTYVPLCKTEDATDEDRKLVQMSSLMFDAYCQRDFEQCIEASKALEDHFGESKLARLYRHLAEQYEVLPPNEGFGGEIVLESK